MASTIIRIALERFCLSTGNSQLCSSLCVKPFNFVVKIFSLLLYTQSNNHTIYFMGIFEKFLGGGKQNPGVRGKFREIYELAKPSLNLSAEQQQKIEEIFREFQGERKQIKTKTGANQHEEMKEARLDAKEKVLAVLTPEQQQIFHANIDKWRSELK